MCLVIDTCAFYPVFSDQPEKNGRFAPILRWLLKGKGKLIFGGTTFAKELRSARAISLLKQLDTAKKLVRIPDEEVDAMERLIKTKEPAGDFDDPHLVALVALSRCCVVCTDEKKAVAYLKRKDLYPDGVNPPKIYRNKKHADLCCDKHIVKVCK